MSKKSTLVLLIGVMLICTGQFVFSQSVLPEHQFAAGKWDLKGNRLYQNDTEHGLAKINIKVPQSGRMRYRFNARFEGGLEDMHGGFGIHIFADSVYPRASWGSGNSYLLWLNFDANPVLDEIPRGLSAQVYRSYSHSYMELMKSVDLNRYGYILDNASMDAFLPIDIIVNGNTGEVRIKNPLSDSTYFTMDLRNTRPLRGSWIALRTNGMAASFGLME